MSHLAGKTMHMSSKPFVPQGSEFQTQSNMTEVREYIFQDSSYPGTQFVQPCYQPAELRPNIVQAAVSEQPTPDDKSPTINFDSSSHEGCACCQKTCQCPSCIDGGGSGSGGVVGGSVGVGAGNSSNIGELNNICNVSDQPVTNLPMQTSGNGKKQLFCEFCGKKFVQEYVLKVHRRKHTGEKPYECEICSKKFARNDTLRKHKRIHTGQPNGNVSNVGISPSLSLMIAQGVVAQENGVTNTGNPGTMMSSVSNSQPSQRNSQKSYTCDICLKPFAQRHYLQIHKRSHTGERPFHCQVCDRSFTRRDTLIIHQRTHTGVKPFHCEICMQQFAHKHNLQIHKRKHTGEKLFQCDICAELFTRRDYLQIHRRTHTGERPFQCDLCIQKFARRTTLEIHRRTHTGEKPFHCEFCGKQFANRDKLRIHQRTHVRKKPHQCTICLKKFARRDTLEIHSRRHSGLKPFHCDICLKKFAQKDYLQIHKNTVHSGQKPFQCDLCTQKFSRRDSLQRHKKTHYKQVDEVQKATSSITNNNVEEVQPLNKYLWL